MFVGVMTALVTPLSGAAPHPVDERALADLVEAQLAAGVDVLVPCGTTGESATLSPDEQARVIRVVVEAARGRAPVLAGAGSHSTAHAVALSRAAEREGANGLLQVTPYYNRPSQEGLYQHFRAIAEAVGLPVVLYNVPGRTGVDLQVDTVARLCDHPRVVGLKEASGSVQRAQALFARVGERLPILCGDDALNYPLYCVGARGCISVTANVAPKLITGAWKAFVRGDHAEARRLHYQSLPLTEALFSEPSPVPAKAALAMMGNIAPEVRAPLQPMTGRGRERLRAILAELGLA
jgi:4-hydroxy-tetrahydrodipicolinate synthase